MSNSGLIRVVVSLTFRRNIRDLVKKYRNIRQDIQPIIEQLEQGEKPGDQVQGIGYPVFKVRVRSSDLQKGKSGGYRLLYYVETSTEIILLTIYVKSEQVDISSEEIQKIISNYQNHSG